MLSFGSIKEYATKHPESAQDIEDLSSTTYVDDIIAFGATEEDILRKMRVAIAALSEGQMVVTKFRSHPKTAADTLIDELHPGTPPSQVEFKTLGLWYNTTTDEIWSAFEHIHDFDTKEILKNGILLVL